MPIFKVKDENGNWVPIRAIKGDKGDPGPKGDKGDTGERGAQGEPGKDAVTDQSYNPESQNAQSGLAVAEAFKNHYTKAEIDETMGNVETALDNIIAIQTNYINEDLIGG